MQPTADSYLVTLTGAGFTLYSLYYKPPNKTFTSYTVSLTPSGWRLNDQAIGVQPTVTQMQTVLGSLDGLYIEGDWHGGGFGSDLTGLDNVILAGPQPSIPEPSTWLLFATGLVGVLGYGQRQSKKG